MRYYLLSLALVLLPRAGAAQATPAQLAAAMRTLRTSTDTAALKGAFYGAQVAKDSAMYGAAIEIAADPAASPEARTMSLGVLVAYEYDGAFVPYRTLVSGSHPACSGVGASDAKPITFRPLPADYHEQSRQLASTLARDAGTPAIVRHVANCLLDVAHTRAATLPVDPALIQLSYVCGNQFRIRNANARVVTLSYVVVGTDERWDALYVPARADDQPYAETSLTTHSAGAVQLLYAGQVIQTADNGEVACPQ